MDRKSAKLPAGPPGSGTRAVRNRSGSFPHFLSQNSFSTFSTPCSTTARPRKFPDSS